MERLLFSFYKILCLNSIFRLMIGRTEYEVGRYLPFDDYGTAICTARVFLKNIFKGLLIGIISMLVAFFDKKYLVISIVLGVAAYKDSFIKWKRKQEKTILKQLSSYLNELRREYYRFNDVFEAFLAAFPVAGEELKLHLGIIEEEIEGEGLPKRYKEASPSRFLLVFIAICQCAIKYGDNDNTFIANIDELQKNIDSELLKWDREDFVFSAVFYAVSFSLISLSLMEKWAVSQVEELIDFYNGFNGSVTRMGCIIVTLAFISVFFKMQDTAKQGVNPLMSVLMEIRYVNKGIKWLFNHTSIEKKQIANIIDKNFPGLSYQEYILSRLICFVVAFTSGMVWISIWKLKLYFILPLTIISYGLSYLPTIELAIDGIFYQAELEEEIGQVRLMSVSLSAVKGIRADEILIWIENFSFYLQESVTSCIDELDYDEIRAFDELRNRWQDTSFINVIDDLIASDKIGISEAFKDLLSRRDYYSAKRRQEQEITVRRKEAIISTFLYLPFMFSVGVYMIAPFLFISVKNLLDVTINLS